MAIKANKEESGTVSVGATQQPPRVNIAEDVPNGGEGEVHIGSVVHGEKESGQELNG